MPIDPPDPPDDEPEGEGDAASRGVSADEPAEGGDDVNPPGDGSPQG